MVAKGFFGVADTDGSSFGCKAPEGSEATEKIFVEYFTNNGIEVTPVGLTNGSDYAPFWHNLKKPFGYLHTVSKMRVTADTADICRERLLGRILAIIKPVTPSTISTSRRSLSTQK